MSARTLNSSQLVPEVTRLPDDCDYSESEVSRSRSRLEASCTQWFQLSLYLYMYDVPYILSQVESYTTWSNVTHQAGKDTSQRFVLKIRVNGDATPPLLGLNAGFDYFDDALDSLCSLQYYTELVQLP